MTVYAYTNDLSVGQIAFFIDTHTHAATTYHTATPLLNDHVTTVSPTTGPTSSTAWVYSTSIPLLLPDVGHQVVVQDCTGTSVATIRVNGNQVGTITINPSHTEDFSYDFAQPFTYLTYGDIITVDTNSRNFTSLAVTLRTCEFASLSDVNTVAFNAYQYDIINNASGTLIPSLTYPMYRKYAEISILEVSSNNGLSYVPHNQLISNPTGLVIHDVSQNSVAGTLISDRSIVPVLASSSLSFSGGVVGCWYRLRLNYYRDGTVHTNTVVVRVLSA